MHRHLHLVITVIALVSAYACKEDKEKDKTEAKASTATAKDANKKTTKESGKDKQDTKAGKKDRKSEDKEGDAEDEEGAGDDDKGDDQGDFGLVGTWESDCVSKEGSGQGMTLTNTYTASEVTIHMIGYGDETCSKPVFENKGTFTYKLGKAVQGVSGALEIDVSMISSSSKYLDAQLAAVATESLKNAPAPCNKVVYKANTEVDDFACAQTKNYFSLVQPTEDQLKVGDCSSSASQDCSSVAKRAKSTDKDFIYKRK